MNEFALGEMLVTRVEEFMIPMVTPDELFVGMPESAVDQFGDWLGPGGFHPASGRLLMSVHSWIVRTGTHIVLIDACMGNHKSRPALPHGNMLDTPWLSRLAEHGISPEQVDFVMCTHMHSDHVGWNTRLLDGRWVPTFPNAKYVFSRREYEFWDPSSGGGEGWGQEGVFEDSVLPCVQAGQVELVDDGYAVDDALVVEAAPGHTEGNIVIRAQSAGSTGLFSGDCLHTPLQIAYPEVNTIVCADPDQSRATRRRILEDCAEHGHLLMPAHFPPPFVGRISAHANGFRYHPGSARIG